MIYLHRENFERLICAIFFIFISILLIIISIQSYANNYEISIYSAYPSLFWVILIGTISLGIIISATYILNNKISKYLNIILFLIIFCNIILLSLPSFRGYYNYSVDDEPNHLGQIIDIVNSHQIGNSDSYPGSHILSYIISQITGTDFRFGLHILPITFYILYIFGIFLLVRTISSNQREVVLTLLFGVVLSFTYYHFLFLPTQFGLEFIPLILMITIKFSNSLGDIRYLLLFLIVFFQLPFLHPLATFFGIIILLLIFTALLLSNKLHICIIKTNLNKRDMGRYILKLLPVCVIIFFIWFYRTQLFAYVTNITYRSIIFGGSIPLESVISTSQQLNFSFYDLLILIIKMYGHNLIFCFLTIFGILLLIIKNHFSKKGIRIEIFLFTILFLFFTLFYCMTLISPIMITGYSQRLFCWALFCSIFLNGMVFTELLQELNPKIERIFLGLLVLLIVLSGIIGVFSLFPSPYIKQFNSQGTYAEWVSQDWLIHYKNTDPVVSFDKLFRSYQAAIYGYSQPVPENFGNLSYPPNHFGYDKYNIIINSINKGYLQISERSLIVYTELYKTEGRVNIGDINRLERDLSINKIYYSKGFTVYNTNFINTNFV